MGNTLKIVRLAMSKVVHWVYVPFCSGAVVRSLDDAIHYRIAEVHVRVGHIYFGAQHICAFVEFTLVHAFKQIKVFFDWTIPVWAFYAGSCWCAFLFGNLFGSLLVNISFTFFDKANSQVVKLWKIVRSIIFAVAPIVS